MYNFPKEYEDLINYLREEGFRWFIEEISENLEILFVYRIKEITEFQILNLPLTILDWELLGDYKEEDLTKKRVLVVWVKGFREAKKEETLVEFFRKNYEFKSK